MELLTRTLKLKVQQAANRLFTQSFEAEHSGGAMASGNSNRTVAVRTEPRPCGSTLACRLAKRETKADNCAPWTVALSSGKDSLAE